MENMPFYSILSLRQCVLCSLKCLFKSWTHFVLCINYFILFLYEIPMLLRKNDMHNNIHVLECNNLTGK